MWAIAHALKTAVVFKTSRYLLVLNQHPPILFYPRGIITRWVLLFKKSITWLGLFCIRSICFTNVTTSNRLFNSSREYCRKLLSSSGCDSFPFISLMRSSNVRKVSFDKINLLRTQVTNIISALRSFQSAQGCSLAGRLRRLLNGRVCHLRQKPQP